MYEFKITGKNTCEAAREIVRAARHRLNWRDNKMERPLEAEFIHVCGTWNGVFSVTEDDARAVELIAEDGAKYHQSRGKKAMAKACDSIRAKIAEKRINENYLSTFGA